MIDAGHSREELGRKLLYDIGTGRCKEAFALVAEGAWLNVENGSGATALSLAAAAGQSGLVKELLARNVEINHKDHEGFTPLMRAVQSGDRASLSALLEAGANADEKNNAGESALDIAKAENRFVAAMLIADVLHAQAEKRAEQWKDISMETASSIPISRPLKFKIRPR